MIRLNAIFQLKAFQIWIQWCHRPVQFKSYLCNQVGDIAGNEVSPTKQARGDSGKEPKLHRWQNGDKALGETRLSSPLARQTSSLFQPQQSQIVRAPLVPVVFSR